MNLLDLCGDIHYLINQEIKKTEHFNLRVHKDKFKKVLAQYNRSLPIS